MVEPAMAQQFGMDEQYNGYVDNSMQGVAQNSTADGNTQAYHTDESGWQDMQYVQNQYAPLGNVQAPIQSTANGAVSTYKGTKGSWKKGAMPSGQQLPRTRAGLQAMGSAYSPAAMWGGTSGFYNIGGGSRKYPLLPPTATSSVILNTAW